MVIILMLSMNFVYITLKESLANSEKGNYISYNSNSKANPMAKYQQNCEKLSQYDRNYGNSYDVFVEKRLTRTIAYVADGWGGLVILEVTDPSNPRFLAAYTNTSETNGIFVMNKIAYVTQWQDGMLIIDVSNLRNPKRIGFYENTSNPWGVIGKGTNIFIADGYDGMIILDVQNPAEPIEISKHSIDNWGVYDIQFQGNYAFIVGRQLGILDISNIANITIVSTLEIYDGLSFGLYVNDQIVYIFAWDEGLYLVNITNILHPEIISWHYDARFNFIDGCIYEKALYILCEYSGLYILDITNITNLQKITELTLIGYYYNMFQLKNNLYLADIYGGIKIMEFKNPPQNIEFVGYFRDSGEATEILVEDSIAYVANGYNGLQILDVENPKRPKLLSNHLSGRTCYTSIDKQGDLVYLVNQYGQGIEVYNVSNPKNPIKITDDYRYNNYYFSNNELVISDSYGYVLSAYSGMWEPYSILYIMNVTNGENITQITELSYSNEYIRGLAVKDEIIFLGSYNGLYIINGSDPKNLQLLSTFTSDYNRVYDITIHNNYAFLAIYNYGLKIIDISNLTEPKEVAAYQTSDHPYFEGGKGISYENGYCYMIDEDEGVLVFNVTIITEPKLVGQFYEITDQYWIKRELFGINLQSISVKDNIVYLAATLDGVIVIHYEGLPMNGINRPTIVYVMIFTPITIGVITTSIISIWKRRR